MSVHAQQCQFWFSVGGFQCVLAAVIHCVARVSQICSTFQHCFSSQALCEGHLYCSKRHERNAPIVPAGPRLRMLSWPWQAPGAQGSRRKVWAV